MWLDLIFEKVQHAVTHVPGGNVHRILRLCAASVDLCCIFEEQALEKEALVGAEQDDPKQSPELSALEKPAAQSPVPRRSRGTVNSPIAAARMRSYMDAMVMGQAEFAEKAKTTERTIRSFEKTGKVRKDIFNDIASAMGISREDLIKPDPTGK
jgi:hypothetical protein